MIKNVQSDQLCWELRLWLFSCYKFNLIHKNVLNFLFTQLFLIPLINKHFTSWQINV